MQCSTALLFFLTYLTKAEYMIRSFFDRQKTTPVSPVISPTCIFNLDRGMLDIILYADDNSEVTDIVYSTLTG